MKGAPSKRRGGEHWIEKRPSRDRPDAAHWQRVAGLSSRAARRRGKKRSGNSDGLCDFHPQKGCISSG
ncbi:hypothetical protein DAX92_26670 [Salmonella enterica subsp. enterica]|uniref:Uncharacterized protein n=1 Tax=Salmonella enterica I TaxID=59201 RepID=A0A7Z1TE79_SALET|nr:hypothetical protein DAX92_26670 [Salmonella enterica subsp. enterica]PUF51773.1 hypothetical protein DAX73_26595 [Salmonella enterica subsp. enterica]